MSEQETILFSKFPEVSRSGGEEILFKYSQMYHLISEKRKKSLKIKKS